MFQPIIMAGGTGSRLWPLSRELYPKQFHKLYGDVTMLQATILRLKGLNCLPPLVICNEDHRFIVAEQLRQIGQLEHNILLEPVGRNTAPAIALAALFCQQKKIAEPLLVLAADHLIRDEEIFQNTIRQAGSYTEQGKLVTFGIIPNQPETGYGYIQCGVSLNNNAFEIARFVEKPSLEVAKRYLQEGNYLWNSGMFAFQGGYYLQELQKYRPDIYDNCTSALQNIQQDLDFIRVDRAIFSECPEDSIDYAVMEKTSDGIVIPMDAGWNDIGAWQALWEVSPKDNNDNVLKGDVITVESNGNYVWSENGLVATVGLQDTIIVNTKDALLVANKHQSQEIKQVVKQLQLKNRREVSVHREMFTPWGKYDVLDEGSRYQVRRISIKPGKRISCQQHYHRSEHWVVVSGTAKIIIDGKEQILSENQSIYVPLGSVHSLENPGKINVELIEIQVGSYLNENDIVRFEEMYEREKN